MKPLLLFIWMLLLISCHTPVPVTIESGENVFYEKAYNFLDNNEQDSAFLYFEKARSLFLEKNDSVGVAKSLINMALTQTEFGDYFGSQETSTQAIEYLNLKDSSQFPLLGMVYSNLAEVHNYLRNPKESIENIQLAIQFTDNADDKKVFENNLANSYVLIKEYDKAIQLFQKIVATTDKKSINYARFITNYARARYSLDSNFNPLPQFMLGMQIREDLKDLLGLNSSYSHISDYYQNKNKDSSLFYSMKHLEVAKKIKNPDAQMKALQNVLELSVIPRNQPFLIQYHEIEDSVKMARMTAKNQFALIRYEVEKNKTNNLRLSNEVSEKQYRLILLRIYLVAFIIFTVFGGYYIWFWYKRRRQRMELEAENRVKESQLKTSRKVHDVVANGIYRVMAELENRVDIDREELLDRLEVMYDKSRDISYEVEDLAKVEVPFHLVISELLKSFSHENRTILIAGNDEELWDIFNSSQKIELEQILQELMVNMRKHSKAHEVIIKFNYEAGKFHVFYKDDGIGLTDSLKSGNGLKNTENRINLLRGTLTFEKNTNSGLGIQISIPVQK